MTLIHYFKGFKLTAAKPLLPDTNVDNFELEFVIHVEKLILLAFLEMSVSP